MAGSYDVADSAFKLIVNAAPTTPAPDTTSPTITPTITGTLGNDGWYTSDVSLSWTVSDSESAISSKTGCDSVSITSDQQSTSYTCSAKSAGGTSEHTVSIKRDATAPSITDKGTTQTATNGWYNADVTNTFESSDATSDLADSAKASIPVKTSGEGEDLTVSSGDVYDKAGNKAASKTSAGFDVDKTAPVITDKGATTSPNAAGWYKSAVTNTFEASDKAGGSGFSGQANPYTFTKSSGTAEGSAVKVSSGTVKDQADNEAVAVDSAAFKIDLTAPGAPTNLDLDTASDKGSSDSDDVTNDDTPTINGKAEAGSSVEIFDGSTSLATVTADANGNWTYTPSTALGNGKHQITAKATDQADHTSSTSDPLNITIDTKAPTVKDDGATPGTPDGENGWYVSAVTNQFSASDETGGSGLPSGLTNPWTVSSGTAEGGAVKVSSGTVSDVAGNAAAAIDSVAFKIDLSAPSISDLGPTAAANGQNGWYVSAVNNEFQASDKAGGSGLASSLTNPWTVSSGTAEGGAVKVSSGTVKDQAGHVAAAIDSAAFKIDLTKPVITDKGATTSPNAAGWYKSAVTNTFEASDKAGGSGLPSSLTNPFTKSSGTSEGSAVKISSGSVSDVAGNATDAIDSAPFKIDLSTPQLNISGAANDTAYNVCDTGPSRPTYNPTDAISGIFSKNDTWTPPNTASGVGTYTYEATAKDNADNTVSEKRTYTKTYGSSANSGALQPINGGSTTDLSDDNSRFKLGSTVPVKFQLKCGTTLIDNAVAKLNIKKADGTPDPGVDEPVSTAASTTGNLFRYDATSQQYIFNLSTKTGFTNPTGTTVSWTPGTYTLSIMLDDGSYRSVNINIVK